MHHRRSAVVRRTSRIERTAGGVHQQRLWTRRKLVPFAYATGEIGSRGRVSENAIAYLIDSSRRYHGRRRKTPPAESVVHTASPFTSPTARAERTPPPRRAPSVQRLIAFRHPIDKQCGGPIERKSRIRQTLLARARTLINVCDSAVNGRIATRRYDTRRSSDRISRPIFPYRDTAVRRRLVKIKKKIRKKLSLPFVVVVNPW